MTSSPDGRPAIRHAPDALAAGDVDAYIVKVQLGQVDDRATLFAIKVQAGEIIAGEKVRQSTARHLRDLRDAPGRGYLFSLAQANYVQGFFRFCSHTKGKLQGEPIVLELWQAFTIGVAYGWLRKRDLKRRFGKGYVEVGKKNGKSTLMSGVGLYHLVADGEKGAEVYALATAKKQARIVFGDALRMATVSPPLREKIRRLNFNMSVEETYSKFEPLSGDVDLGDGLNPSAAIADELHRHKTPALINLFKNAMGAREQGFFWMITTSGTDRRETPYDSEHTYASKVLSGAIEDDSYFAIIFAPDAEDDYRDEATHRKANPNWGVSVRPEELADLAREAAHSPAALADFKRLRLNVRGADTKAAISMPTWSLNTLGARPIAAVLELVKGRVARAAFDLSATTDLTATVHLFEPLEERGDKKAKATLEQRWIIVPRFFMPELRVLDRAQEDNAPYGRWIEDGFITATEGNRVDETKVEAQFIEDAARWKVRECIFDSWRAGAIEKSLEDEGFLVTEFVQGIKSYSHPTAEFLAMLLDGDFEHFDNPVLRWMASNLALKTDVNKNQMPAKQRSRGRIDGMTATIMALGHSISPVEDEGAAEPAVIVL